MKPWLCLSFIGCLLAFSGLGCGDGGAAPADSLAPVERTALASGEAPAKHGPSAFVADKIGQPLWEPVDFHQMTVDLSPYAPTYIQPLLLQILPSPDHVWNDALGIAPGAPHPGPYDDEIGSNLAGFGFKAGSVFSTAEAIWPNAILGLFMVVPSAGAPLGSSPDFDHGPIIPHTICPIHVDGEFYDNGAAKPIFISSFDVHALDTIDPPIHAEGHSHFPIFTVRSHGEPPRPGNHRVVMKMMDTEGNGWEIKQTFVLQ